MNYVIYADKETHEDLSEMAAMASIAARKKVSIKQVLKEMVEESKSKQSGQIKGVSYDLSKGEVPVDLGQYKEIPGDLK